MVSFWRLNDRKVSSDLQILAYLNKVMMWMALILHLISSSPSLFSRPLEIIPMIPASIGIIFMFHAFSSFVYLFAFFHFSLVY